MKVAILSAIVIAGVAAGQSAAAADGDTVQIKLRHTAVVDRAGVTAAHTMDEDVADASALEGRVTVYGRGAGTTRLVVVAGSEVEIYDLVVVAPPPLVS